MVDKVANYTFKNGSIWDDAKYLELRKMREYTSILQVISKLLR